MKDDKENKGRVNDRGRVWKPVPGIPYLHYCVDRTLEEEDEEEQEDEGNLFGDVFLIILSLGVLGVLLLRWLQ